MLIEKPMLAASMEEKKKKAGKDVVIKKMFKDLTYPLGASDKLDGIRCLTGDDEALSRSFKPIPNKYIQDQIQTYLIAYGLIDLDGEITTLNKDGSRRTFNEIQGDVMSEDGEPDFRYEIFDYVKDSCDTEYQQRIEDLKQLWQDNQLPDWCILVLPTVIHSADELAAYEEKALAAGHEGIMTRNLKGGYKFGRCTFKSQDLIKVKRFVDSEAEVIGFEEKMRNENEATKDELGHTKRSSAKSGLVAAGTLGTFLVRDIHDGRTFGIGTGKGLNDKLRKDIWDNQDKYLGKILKYQYQLVGTKDNPRIPSFQGWRNPIDMGEPTTVRKVKNCKCCGLMVCEK